MLLSPPFILKRAAGETENQLLNRAMVVGNAGNGGFPVSFEMNWHSGVHLTAPKGDASIAPVRAIADGKVLFARKPTARNNDAKHPLNYRNWTDDGCVVLQHETEIGYDSAKKTLTRVRFLSIYMHLKSLSKLTVGALVYRKDELGAAGSIYGIENQMQLEIVCDDENVKRITGRNSPFSPVDTDGRKDAVFGTIWFFCPLGTSFLASVPKPKKTAPKVVFKNDKEALFFSLRFVGMDAEVGSYHVGGKPLSNRVLTATDYVRNLFDNAQERYPNSASAGVELLRYGRVLGPDRLSPVDAPNWLEVPLATGTGFVNLNAAGIRRFSDADFPSWDGGFKHGWVLVDEGGKGDSRCTNPRVKELLDINNDSVATPEEATQRLKDPYTQSALAHKICKFVTPWDEATLDARTGWLRREKRLNQTDYKKMFEHARALCFWKEGELGVPGYHWHFHPREFIRHFKKCNWLGELELAQCAPKRIKRLRGTAFEFEAGSKYATSLARAKKWAPGLNLMLRKHLISETPTRIAHFLTQVYTETGHMGLVVEKSAEHKDYAPYWGRGLIQITWLKNYKKYGKYRGFPTTPPPADPKYADLGWDPDLLIARTQTDFDPFTCADSAGFYWLTHDVDNNGLARADGGTTLATMFSVSKYVNGEFSAHIVNGLDVRYNTFLYMKYILMDFIRTSLTEQLKFDWRANSAKETVIGADGKPEMEKDKKTGKDVEKKRFKAATHTVDFPLDPLRP